MCTAYWICKDCSCDTNMLGFNGVCSVCKTKNHTDHMCSHVSLTDLNRERQRCLDDLESQKDSDDSEKNIHFGLSCSVCRRDGVSFRSTSYKCEQLYLCDECFVQGAYKNLLEFAKITAEYADTQRKTHTRAQAFVKNVFDMNMEHHRFMHEKHMDMMKHLRNTIAGQHH